MRNNLQANLLMPAPLMVALVTHWIKCGVAEKIVLAIRKEAMGRQQLARKVLREISYSAKPNGHHLWLPLPFPWSRARFLSHVLHHGLAVVGDDAFAVGSSEAPSEAVRISLGAARNRAELAQALHFLVDTLKSSLQTRQIV
jgi:DNA-binding transcriptional MocR family regulator